MYLSNLKHVPGYGTATSTEHTAKLVLEGKGRFGRGVTTASAERALENAAKQHSAKVAKILGENEAAFSETTNEARRVRLLRQREILTTLAKLGERKLHAYELAAILAFKHGFTSELHQYVNTARALNKKYSVVNGSLMNVGSTVRNSALKRIHDMLLAEKKPLTGIEIAQKLKINPRFGVIPTTSLAILDHMGLVRKLPLVVSEEGGLTFPYLHEEHALNPETKHLTVPEQNAAFRLLKALHEKGGAAKCVELQKPEDLMGKIRGNPKSTFSRQSIIHNAKNLARFGLITISRVSLNGGTELSFQLTSKASKLVGNTLEKMELPEELRLMLLGQAKKVTELNPQNQHTFDKLVTWLEIIHELTKEPRISPNNNVNKIAKRLGINKDKVRTASRGRIPFNPISLKTIQSTYVPKLTAERPDLVPVLEGYLAARAVSLGEKAFMPSKITRKK
ncbi:MAG: hypothetical protein Q8R15_00405 [Candidatus Micrarchaeota archaeon]|nr:hypothetical protein [Candidatus Micrarchaeota archaeon]